ncbi:hypothetical protein GOODEAATRI_015086, partial [Goodea atripinnis]
GVCKTLYFISEDARIENILLTKTRDLNNCQERLMKDIGLAYTEKCEKCQEKDPIPSIKAEYRHRGSLKYEFSNELLQTPLQLIKITNAQTQVMLLTNFHQQPILERLSDAIAKNEVENITLYIKVLGNAGHPSSFKSITKIMPIHGTAAASLPMKIHVEAIMALRNIAKKEPRLEYGREALKALLLSDINFHYAKPVLAAEVRRILPTAAGLPMELIKPNTSPRLPEDFALKSLLETDIQLEAEIRPRTPNASLLSLYLAVCPGACQSRPPLSLLVSTACHLSAYSKSAMEDDVRATDLGIGEAKSDCHSLGVASFLDFRMDTISFFICCITVLSSAFSKTSSLCLMS